MYLHLSIYKGKVACTIEIIKLYRLQTSELGNTIFIR